MNTNKRFSVKEQFLYSFHVAVSVICTA